ncbi:hypothetical protein HELRODRAFT_69527 [Helobdella robusta]|uniref:Nudix hydrolase domain-containing protein n=1 Tax=Helobdella robusta TaxID=6412 RepID=T1FZW5_HELRO|nr:hypothetical protein HELRODRAFT_69527 [Helobdella robusta]ESN93031.1 hypothetical protein HELRODRAFT_69527 [Helobdella robusta]
MQMRSEGNLGFGGGLLDSEVTESVVDCLNREYQEELNLDLEKCKFKQEDHIMTAVNHKLKFVTHFYAHEVSNESFYEIEKDSVNASHWGTETFGIVRVPLFVVDSDKFRGLPVFLANCFAGCAREQLMETIKRKQLIPLEDLQFACKRFKDYMAVQSLCKAKK